MKPALPSVSPMGCNVWQPASPCQRPAVSQGRAKYGRFPVECAPVTAPRSWFDRHFHAVSLGLFAGLSLGLWAGICWPV